MTIVLIDSKTWGFVVCGEYSSECEADKAIAEIRKETVGTWVDAHRFEVYSGTVAEHMKKVYGN